MQRFKNHIIATVISVTLAVGECCWPWPALASPFGDIALPTLGDQDGAKPSPKVELQADQVGFSSSDNKATARGNVVVKNGAETLYCDQFELDRGKQEGIAEGHVYLDAPQMQVDADKAQYNFTEKTGKFDNARIFNAPFQIKGEVVAKVAEGHFVMNEGYMTTCDHDTPHFRMGAHRMDVYPGEKAVARGVKMYLGKMPIMYLPRFTQNLKDRPWFTFTPGYKKDLGYFLLTRSRMKVNDFLTTTLKLDFYERQGIGWGLDNRYAIPNGGEGAFKTYFINERSIAAKHPWALKTAPTIQNERYLVNWRHKWDIDNHTNAIWQYYRLSDDVLRKKYFEREYRTESNTDTYFLLTRNLPQGTLSFRLDRRVNRFVSAVDRTPEIKYDVSALPIGNSGVYLKSTSSFVDLVSRAASPTEDRRKTTRVSTDNELSYPMKVSFIQFTPFVGGDVSYYSRTNDPVRRGKVLRGTFKTGSDLSTRFMKTFNVQGNLWGMKVDNLRHVIAPSVGYKYQHVPSFHTSRLNIFDSIDSLDKEHYISYALENKLQTKRNKNTVDLLRNLTTATYQIREKGVKGQLGSIRNHIEFKPNDWLTLNNEMVFDHKKDHFSSGSFDMYVNASDKLQFNIGERYTRNDANEFVTEVNYIINPKWRVRVFDRFDQHKGTIKEEGYTIIRDLHEWEMEVTYNQLRGSGMEFLIVFNLKAFPSMPFNLLGTTFHQRKAGSQSSEGL